MPLPRETDIVPSSCSPGRCLQAQPRGSVVEQAGTIFARGFWYCGEILVESSYRAGCSFDGVAHALTRPSGLLR